MPIQRKIHFINRIDRTNVGDWTCCPLTYYFNFFQDYNIIRHDIDFIDFREINRNDIVVIGGSGMINVTRSFNENINRVLEKCDNVIAWSIGFNTHGKQWYQGEHFEPIAFSKFKLVTIRDYDHPSGLEWLPCPSALAPELRKKREVIRPIGVIEHKDLPISGMGFDKISNALDMDSVTDFISESDAIVTNSYHMAYWAQLMGRKAIVLDKFSSKFDYFKYKPEFINSDEGSDLDAVIKKSVNEAAIYAGVIEEAISLNNSFFERVRLTLQSLNLPVGNDYQKLYQIVLPKTWNLHDSLRKSAEIFDQAHRLNERIDELHDDVHGRIDRENTELHARINGLHSDVHGRIDRENAELHSRVDVLEERIKKLSDSASHLEQPRNKHRLFRRLTYFFGKLLKK